MHYSQPVTALIQTRTSRRSYTDRQLSASLWAHLEKHLAKTHTGPFDNAIRLAIFRKNKVENDKRIKLGTYGFIQNARYFLIGAVKLNHPKALLDYGYCFEKAILFLTGLGLGSCWLGGSLRREEFAKAVDAAAEESIPAVSPFGYTAHHRSIRDRLIRMAANSKSRKPWQDLFFDGSPSNPLSREKAGHYAVPLEMVRLAPSASNKQPWRMIQQQKAVHLFLQRSKGYGGHKIDLQRIDMGIAMCHFELTAIESDTAGRWLQCDSHPEWADAEYVATWSEERFAHPTQRKQPDRP